MTTAQRIIKYCAIAFAIAIIAGIIQAFLGILGVFTSDSSIGEVRKEAFEIKEDQDISRLILKYKAGTVEIATGDFAYETNNEKLKVNVAGDTIELLDKSNNSFHFNSNKSYLKIFIPEDLVFNTVDIEIGAAKVKIDKLYAKKIDYEVGAGATTIKDIRATEEFKAETGAGAFKIKNGVINNLTSEFGAGEVTINANLTGTNKLDCGIGSLNLKLLDSIENYTIKASKGLGEIKLNGDKLSDGKTVGNGINTVYLEGGVGSIKVDTTETKTEEPTTQMNEKKEE